MSLYGDYDYHEPGPIREPYYSGEYDSEPGDFYPADDEDEGWPYPDEDEPSEVAHTPLTPDYLPASEEEAWRDEPDYEDDLPNVPTETVRDNYIYNRITEDDPVETDDPDDMRGWC